MRLQLGLLFGILFMAQGLWAAQELVFRQQTKVYSQRNPKAKVLTVYGKGDRVPVSSGKYGAWKKIIAEVRGKKQVGWVLNRDIRGAKIQNKDVDHAYTPSGIRRNLPRTYRKKIGAGVFMSLSYYNQGSGDQELEGTYATMKASSQSGMAPYVGVFGDFILGAKMNLRGYLAMRDMSRSGDAIFPPGVDSKSTRINQKGISLGSTLKIYSHPDSSSWWGGGLELTKVSKTEIEASGGKASFKKDLFYIFGHLALGYDFQLYKDIYILPEFRLGAAFNGEPFILNAEILIPVGYRF